jgi:hypothetical protein
LIIQRVIVIPILSSKVQKVKVSHQSYFNSLGKASSRCRGSKGDGFGRETSSRLGRRRENQNGTNSSGGKQQQHQQQQQYKQKAKLRKS